jgi:hypothetical protein
MVNTVIEEITNLKDEIFEDIEDPSTLTTISGGGGIKIAHLSKSIQLDKINRKLLAQIIYS